MVGIAGSLGETRADARSLADGLQWLGHEHTSTYDDDDAAIYAAFHEEREQPARAAEGDVLIWVWGDLYGHDGPDGYVPRSESAPSRSAAEYCAMLYDEHGLDFVRGLNSEFAGIVYDRSAGVVSLFSDRLGSRPLFHSRTGDGALVFSSHLQSIPRYPTVETGIDVEYLSEFFGMERVLGVKTPIQGVESVHPGAILQYDLDAKTIEQTVYWRPRYSPADRPYSQFVDEFMELFQRVMEERIEDRERYGVLISGGSDSRFMLASLLALGDSRDFDVTAYHMNEYMNEEARVARRATETAGVQFELLERDRGYLERTLERGSYLSNYTNWFDQAHTIDFTERLRAEQDAVLLGLYSDTLFKGYFLPRHGVRVPHLDWRVELPYYSRVTNVPDFAARCAAGSIDRGDGIPGYLRSDRSLEEIVRSNVSTSGRFVTSHGVQYPSITELVLCQYYPLSQDDAFFQQEVLGQILPFHNPFLDNRLVDFSLRIPRTYLLRRDLVNAALNRLNPDLAAIPHAETGLPLCYPRLLQHVSEYLKAGKGEILSSELQPGPWADHAATVRTTGFTIETIRDNETLIRDCPFFDYDAVVECYENHLDGADNVSQLYPLLSFLEIPVSRQLVPDQGRATGRAD